MAPEEYARAVVGEAMKPSPRAQFWYGAQTLLVWFGDTFLWKTCWVSRSSFISDGGYGMANLIGLKDSLFWKMFEMQRMVPKIASKKIV